ncbi:MAG: GEVED domain-containing protein [Flavobacteriaceae bacterium]|nr:GEVED domain-containing protein [Flavobacteriaceae bacterium]
MKYFYFWMLTLFFSGLAFSQLQEDFESDIYSNGWVQYATETFDPGFEQTSTHAHSGTYSYYHNDLNIPGVSTSYLVSPQYTVQEGDVFTVYIQQLYSNQFYSYSGIWISTNSGNPITNNADFVELQEMGAGFAEGTWVKVSIDLASYEGQNVYFAFKYTGDFNHEFYIDDLYVGEVCDEPQATSSIVPDCGNQQFSIMLDFTSLGSGESVIVTDNFENTQTVSTIGTQLMGPYTSGSTVTLQLSSSDNEACSSTIVHTHHCPPINDDCSGATQVTSFPFNETGNAIGATQTGPISCGNNAMNDGVWYTFEGESAYFTINLTSTGWESAFSIYSGACGELQCVAFHDVELNGPSYSFIGQAGLTYYVNIGNYNAVTDQPEGPYVLEILSEAIPCASPSNLSIAAVTDLSGLASWQANSENASYDLIWGPTGFTPGAVPNASGITTTTYTLTQLTPETTYDLYVRGNCAPGYSVWVGPVTFTTLDPGSILPGTDCAHPINITSLPYTTQDNTANYGDDYDGGQGTNCGSTSQYYLNGDDVVYAYTPTEDTSINISMDPNDGWSGIFVYEDCNDIGVVCVTGVANSGSTVRVINDLLVTGGQTYYILISTWASPQSTAYTLEITENSCVPAQFNLLGVGECDADEFEVEVNFTDMGSLESYVVTDNVGGSQTITSTGTYTFGPYASGTTINFNFEANDPNCSRTQNFYYLCNDECSGALNVPVNESMQCLEVVRGTIENASDSGFNPCFGTADDDVWFSFVAVEQMHMISLTNITGSTSDLYHAVYSGTCGQLVNLVCSDPENSSVNGLTPGETYYIQVYSWTSTAGQTSSFDICIQSAPQSPSNDECEDAIEVPVNADFSCTEIVSGHNMGATASPQADDVSGTPNNDVWYTFIATNSDHRISLSNITYLGGGSYTTDMAFGVYDASNGCEALTLVDDSDPDTLNITGLIPGNTYLIRVHTWGSSVAYVSYDLCIGTPPSSNYDLECGTPLEMSYCYFSNDLLGWTFNSPSNEPVTISFSAGSVEDNFDIIRIYDGSDASGTLLWDSYNANPGGSRFDLTGTTFSAASGSLHMRFTSDGSVSCQQTADVHTWEFTVNCGLDLPSIDWANLQHPASGNISAGDEFMVYGQVYVEGLTEAEGQAEGIQAWVGYNTENTDPATWTNWFPAVFNVQVGNNDEYMLNLGGQAIPLGTIYYATRFQRTGGLNYYGGYNGGAWDGVTNVNGVLTITGPANNNCADAQTIACGETYTGSTQYATGEPDLDYCVTSAPGTTNGGIWYTFIGDGTYWTLDLSGSSFDTKMWLYTGECGEMTCVTGNDDGGEGTRSLISFASTPGTTYYVYVSGYSTNRGNVSLSVTCQVACDTVIAPELSISSDAGSSGTSITLTADNENTALGMTYQWQSSNDDGETWNNLGAATTAYANYTTSVSGAQGATVLYRLVISCISSGESAISNEVGFTIDDAGCIPMATTSSRYINNFTATGNGETNISNLSSGFSSDGYGNFSHLGVSATAGESISFSADFVGGTYGFRIWVDWNQDNAFDVVEEVVFTSSGYENNHAGSFAVPADVTEGAYKMRIVAHWLSTTADVSPCATGFTYGEFEDYSILIGDAVVDYDCPELETNIGSACDDGNPETVNDIVTADCECVGRTPLPAEFCESAIDLTCNAAPITVNTANFINQNVTSCLIGNNGAWFTFEGTGSSVTINSTASFDHEMSINSGSCGEFVNIVCRDSSTQAESYTMDTAAGVTYYIYVAHWSDGSSNTGEINISITCEGVVEDCIAPEYTTSTTVNCADGTYMVNFIFTDLGSSESLVLTDSESNEFTVSEAGSYEYGPYNTGTEVIFEIATGDDACNSSESFIRNCEGPVNDDCEGAIELVVGAAFEDNAMTATNQHATSSDLADPSCGDYQGGDVWFTVTVPANGSLVVETQSNDSDVISTGLAAYSGSCAGTLTQMLCNSGSYAIISADGLVPGTVYYIRAWSNGGTTGSFQISAYSNDMAVDDINAVAKVSMYPNPTKDVLNISGMDIKDVQVFDASGRMIQVKVNQNVVDVRNLSTGTYIIKLTDMEGKVVLRKFIRK